MKNLEQIRAKHAIEFWERANSDELKGDNGGDVVRGLGSLIINNGLLATASFARDKSKKDKKTGVLRKSGHELLMEEVGRFLGSTGSDGRNLLPKSVSRLDEFLEILTSNSSLLLQQATAEALAYLGYLKRFRIK